FDEVSKQNNEWNKRFDEHAKAVKEALLEGKTVPPSVLRDYPGFEKKYTPTTSTEPPITKEKLRELGKKKKEVVPDG
ncbi:hypothetical protein LAJ57_14225, partial [Streptococcus pneumoniae]|uniref:hypothetical protein n=1 Tax=Streptococcus pneumoniae TaxID=1313 RepID=UPI001CBDEE1C